MELDPGRYRISVNNFSDHQLKIQFERPSDAHYLMIRKGFDQITKKSVSSLKISIIGGGSTVVQGDPSKFSERHFIRLNEAIGPLEIAVESLDGAVDTLVIDEIGLYSDQITSSTSQKNVMILVISILGLIGIIGVVLHRFLDVGQAAIYGSAYVFALAVTFHLALLFVLFSPDWARDLKVSFASGALQEGPGCNFNYGLHMASSILQGKGPLIGDAPPWCRMPGYGFVIALAGSGHDLLQMAMNSVFLQIVFFASSLAFFYWASLRIMTPFSAAVASTVIALMPARFFQIQIESFMPTIMLLCMGAGCLFAHQYEKQGRIPLRYHLLLHLSFAFWFFLRADVIPAWVIVSLILYGAKRRNWKYLFIPFIFVLSIGLSWAIFKLPYTGEFSMTTESVGFSLMGGLWEIPSKFIWEPTDPSVYNWMHTYYQNPCTKTASNFAVNEVVRFCGTYPFYITSLIWHKFLIFAKEPIAAKLIPVCWLRLCMLMVMATAIITRHRRNLILFLGWPVLLNVPTFFVFFSGEGRFYEAPTISLIIVTIFLLFDPGFYQRIYHRPYRTAFVLIATMGILFFGQTLDDYFIQNDLLRYSAPFLDPSCSTLNVLRETLPL